MKVAIPHKNIVRIWDTKTQRFDIFMVMLTIKEANELSEKLNENFYYPMYNKK